ncbi:hypothetical protein CRV02_00900 [Arcobacter sp. CECT 8989]|uniref:hypothetical protein n=1 Tax=Arcobacter sp. CECT 8989 TaxID=2044509 RepID=UPI00100C028A|nr:hypothetical protein [Arcobacter sp. CECT 8989]RXK03783.1 hypothetical protein CRV02_00900 [Arcobacter sp. CECT 8989]
MKLYFYDGKTKEYLKEQEVNKAFGTSLPNTTEKEPLAAKDGFAVCFDGELNKWEQIEDNRNKTVYETSIKQELKVDYLGAIKAEHTLLVPKEFDKWDDATKSWVKDTEAVAKHVEVQAKEQKLKDIEMITATVDTVEYDAHSRGRADLTGVIALANYQFIKALVVSNPEFKTVYDSIYKQTKNWLGKDNKSHSVQIESIAEAGVQAYEKYAEVIGAK